MNGYRGQIEQAVRATAFDGDRFTWFGQPARNRHQAAISAGSTRQEIVHALQQRLYSDFYLPGRAIPRRPTTTLLPVASPHAFIAELDAANTGSGTWFSGWSSIGTAGDASIVRNDRLGLAIEVDGADARVAEDGVAVRMPAALPDWAPGYWFALGDAPFADPDERQVRLYWNLRPDGAAALVEQVTRRLNAAAIPFRLKLLADPSRYTRCDAAVLYLPESALAPAMPHLRAVYRQVRAALKPAVPALTAMLAPGLALADDPAGSESFGSERCRLLAGALVTTAEVGVTRLAERVALVLVDLATNGVAIDAPYLISAAHDQHDSALYRPWTALRPATLPPIRTEPDYTRVAVEIAHHIVGEAVWHGQECAWLGMTGDRHGGQPVYSTLGPDLYGGSAGIALFLGDVHRVTGAAGCREAALGGIRHALAHASDISATAALGLYTGLPGIALAAIHLARSLDEPALLDDAHRLLCGVDQLPSREHDLLSGSAGAILVLVLLHRVTPNPTLLEQAVRLGDRLLDAAQPDTDGYAWRSGRRALTGLSHGASGIGVALLELACLTGQDRFRAAARAALGWERRLFNTEAGNWPDLRRVAGPARRATALPFGTSWCHGAPGIALARIHAAARLGDDTLNTEARIALTTTQREVEAALANGDASACLCHGLAGNAEILLDGAAALVEPAWRDTALAVANAGVERYASDPRRWPSGSPGGATPGLMLGLAGIGRFYLRLADPTLPSILLPVAPVDG